VVDLADERFGLIAISSQFPQPRRDRAWVDALSLPPFAFVRVVLRVAVCAMHGVMEWDCPSIIRSLAFADVPLVMFKVPVSDVGGFDADVRKSDEARQRADEFQVLR
jgi:hypothetical protein